jgi:hypothetical protein
MPPLSFETTIGIVAIGFAFMGVVAILAPSRVTAQFDIPNLTIAGRNEVRAVYGGFGLAICAVLLMALAFEPLRAGICLTIAAALGGMALGRIVSAAIDRSIGGFPLMYMGIEALGAGLLIYAT